MARTNQGSYSFLEFTLDTSTERLFRGPDEIKLRPKTFQVMRYLTEHHGRLVTREELLQAVWSDVAVTDESITKCIAEIRKALADESQEIIRTVTKRGFLIQAEVRLLETAPKAAQVPSFGPWLPSRRMMLVAGVGGLGVATAMVSVAWLVPRSGREHHFDAIARPAF